MEHILEKIKEYNTIIIHGHIRPDGDCIGSQYGLKYIIEETFPDKLVYLTGDTSEYISFIGSVEKIDDSIFENALSICVDTPMLDRLNDNRINLSEYTIKIDHHVDSEKYTDYEYVDATSISCTQIITEFYMKFKDELIMSKDAATALYTGLLTDSGHFKYANVNYKTFLIASELTKHGVDIVDVNNKLSLEKESVLRLKGYCLNKFKTTKNGFAYITLTKEEIKKFNTSLENASSLVTIISNIDNCPIWALFIEEANSIRIRLRSRGPAINELAQKYNGGGHKLASGAKLKSWNELEWFVKLADELVNTYKISFKD